MTISFPPRFLKTAGVIIVALGCAALLGAAPLVPVRVTEQGRVPALAEGRLLVVEGQPFVMGHGQTWIRDGAAAWRATGWQAEGWVAAVFGDGRAAFALIAKSPADAAQGVLQLAFAEGRLTTRLLPPLPEALRNVHGTVNGPNLFVHGVGTAGPTQLFTLSLKDAVPAWRALPGCDAGGVLEELVAHEDALYGVTTPPDGSGQRLYRLTAGQPWVEASRLPGKIVPGAARAVGQGHILFVVDDHGVKKAVTYYTLTRVWADHGRISLEGAQHGMAWRDGFLFAQASGQDLALSLVELVPTTLLLRPLDWVMIFVYLAGISAIGIYCYRREKKLSTAEFFVGSRSIPFWAAGISLYASNSSAIGYIATTAKAFSTNWQYLLGNITNILALFFVAIWIVPLLRRLELTSVFDYLDQRFHRSVRLAASAMCILMHLCGRMSVILFLPALAISTVTGIDVVWSILLMGFVTIGYTALGGMRAVIWTDVAQVTVKFGGLFFAVGFILWRLKGGAGEFVTTAVADDKFKMFDWSFDITKATVWGFIFLQLMETVLTFPKDQVLMQRVFTTKSEKEASRSVWVFAAIILPGSLVLYLVGTGLYVFYHSFPERMNPLLRTDATLPLFIAAELPAGVTGLVFAGLLAAAMGTLSSILNSVATMVTVDFYENLVDKPSPRASIRIAEWVTVLAGLIGIGLAVLLSRFSINSFLDTAIELAGLFGGAFGGAYTLGMFTRRANWQGVLIGMGVSYLSTFVVWWLHLLHPFLYIGFAILVSIVVGYGASFLFPAPTEASIAGLTILTPKRRRAADPA